MDPQRLFFAARLSIALLFFVAGVRKAMAFGATLGYLGALGVPLPMIALPVTIAIEVGGSLLLLLGVRLRWVAPVMALFTLATALTAHQFWSAPPEQFDGQLYNFLKNIAIAGGLLLVAAWRGKHD